jgi:predicted RNase H-like nuclease
VVREVHPEVSFLFLNGRQPMSHSKKRRAGRDERLGVLREPFGDAVDAALAAGLVGCQTDDVLDAFAAVWTAARVLRGQSVTIPERPPRDRFALPMEMVA